MESNIKETSLSLSFDYIPLKNPLFSAATFSDVFSLCLKRLDIYKESKPHSWNYFLVSFSFQYLSRSFTLHSLAFNLVFRSKWRQLCCSGIKRSTSKFPSWPGLLSSPDGTHCAHPPTGSSSLLSSIQKGLHVRSPQVQRERYLTASMKASIYGKMRRKQPPGFMGQIL